MSDSALRESWPFMKYVFIWFVFIAILVSGLMWAGLLARPAWLNLERKAFVASPQYVEGKRTSIATMVAQCNNLREGPQKTELRQRIAAQKALIPTDAQFGLGDC